MIQLGWITKEGDEIDLLNYECVDSDCYCAQLDYAIQYLKKLKKEDPETYEKYRKFSYNYTCPYDTASEYDFLVRVLGWIAVGKLSYMNDKHITFTYYDEPNKELLEKRRSIIKAYEDAGYCFTSFSNLISIDHMEDPPIWFEP